MAIAALSLQSITSCKKSSDSTSPPNTPGNTITPIGTPNGANITKVIGAAGGFLISSDGKVKITIPAGALAEEKTIGIQTLNNPLPSGIGNAYRLTPHGEQFNSPVIITFNYNEQDHSNSLPEFLDVAFQDAQGTWQALTNSTLDKNGRKISVTTTHFSDWTYFKSLKLEPHQATVERGGEVDLKVTTTFPYMDPDDAPPGTTTIPVYTEPRLLREHEMEGWDYAGDGILISRVAEAFYTAPDHEPSTNPEAVVANIHMARKGRFMLVSNITVLSNNNVLYLQVDEDWVRPDNNNKCVLYIFGNFGTDPGANNRSVKIDGTTVETDLWAPTLIRCRIDQDIYGPIEITRNGNVVANSVLRKFKGSFLYERYHGGILNSNSSNPLKETTRFDLVYRGFGAPRPATVPNTFDFQKSLANGTDANFRLSGSAAVTVPGTCPVTTSVSLPVGEGIQPLNPLSVQALSGFKSYVEEVEGGINVELFFQVNNVLTNVKVQRSNCNYTSYDTPKNLGCSIEGFSYEEIALEFDGTDKLKLRGTNKISSGRISSGILIEAWDGTGNPSHYETDGLMPATIKHLP